MDKSVSKIGNPRTSKGMTVASANATDGGGSGIATSGCDPVDTSLLGPQSVDCFATDNLGQTAYGSATYLVYAYAPGGGAFVIGDLSMSGTVTFWGAQWWKANSLSGGSAPSSFKGFARTLLLKADKVTPERRQSYLGMIDDQNAPMICSGS